MIRLEMKDYNMILTKKLKKYQHYHQVKLINMKEILPSDKSRIIDQTKFTYSPLGKASEKQTKTIEEQGERRIK